MNSFEKKFTLSFKIAVSFGIVIAIAFISGSISVWIMKNVSAGAVRLGEEYIPEISVANNIERFSLRTVNAMQSYILSRQTLYSDTAKENFAVLKLHIKTVQEYISRFSQLIYLKQTIHNISIKIEEFEQIANQIIAINEKIIENRRTFDEIAELHMEKSLGLLNAHKNEIEKKLKNEYTTAAEAESLQKNFYIISKIEDVVRSGETICDQYSDLLISGSFLRIQNSSEQFDVIFEALKEIKKNTKTESKIRDTEEIHSATGVYRETVNNLIQNWAVLQNLSKKSENIGTELLKEVVELSEKGMTETLLTAKKTQENLLNASRITVAGLIVGNALSIFFAWIMIVRLTRPIRRITNDLLCASDEVNAVSEQISAASQSLAEGLTEQASSSEQTSESLENIFSATRKNAGIASQTNLLMNETNHIIDKAKTAMDVLSDSMKGVVGVAGETYKIVNLIDEIAFQTNLLSLNASIEAARAGEAGAGFSVVADEVRNLALRVTKAAKNTSELIQTMVSQIKEGSESVSENSNLFGQVAMNVTEAGMMVNQIAQYSDDQTQKIELINKAVSEIDKIIQQNSETSQESASTSEELKFQADHMREFVREMMIMVEGDLRREGCLTILSKNLSLSKPV